MDYYHATEHVWTVAHAVYGQGSPEATAWAKARCSELFEHGAGPVLEALGRLRPATAEANEVVCREQGYFRSNRERMAYPEFRAQELPIGSGAAESAAKHVVQLRMKQPGTRWSDAGAQGVLAVRAHCSSRRPLTGTRTSERPAA